MKSTLQRFSLLPCLVLFASGCHADSAVEPQGMPPSLIVAPPSCSPQYDTSGILEPINADGSTTIQLGRTLPVKVRYWDCATHAGVNTLAPQISLAFVDPGVGEPVDLISSSAADDGTTMRSAGDGQYIFNLSTKRSQFNDGSDLRSGIYELTITEPNSPSVKVLFKVRP